jgi:hypothetical protein
LRAERHRSLLATLPSESGVEREHSRARKRESAHSDEHNDEGGRGAARANGHPRQTLAQIEALFFHNAQ